MSASRAMSQTESMILLKDSGLSIACGPTTDGFVWPNLVVDMLLQQVLASDRYDKVIVINFDRSSDDIKLTTSSKSSSTLCNNDKMVIVDGTSVIAGIDSLESILEKVMMEAELCNEIHKQNNKTNNNNNNNNNNEKTESNSHTEESSSTPTMAIFVYSCSALDLSIGNNQTLSFLRNLLKITNIVISVIHENLHAKWKLTASYKSLANTFCLCVPNQGQMSPIIALEIHTVCRTTSGRVNETHELFALPSERGMNKWQKAQLKHMPKMQRNEGNISVSNFDNDDNEENKSNSKNKDKATDTIAEIESVFGSSVGLTVDKESNKEILPKQTKTNQVSRLITFQSTDPEFDEDSDPDADLDL